MSKTKRVFVIENYDPEHGLMAEYWTGSTPYNDMDNGENEMWTSDIHKASHFKSKQQGIDEMLRWQIGGKVTEHAIF